MPNKNWQAICKIADPNFRLLLATTKDPYILAGLEVGFPELFSEREVPLRVPASALREAARQWSRGYNNEDTYLEEDGEICWTHILDRFAIPILLDATSSDYGGVNIPKDMAQQLVGQRYEAGLSVTYRGMCCLVIDLGIEEKVNVHNMITEVPTIEWIRLIDADHVDLNA